jgi:hypothetical protein
VGPRREPLDRGVDLLRRLDRGHVADALELDVLVQVRQRRRSEWPTSSARRPSGTAASSTAWRSSASASVEKSQRSCALLSPWPRRS